MRVIAGSAGGIQLFVPKRDVRPTMDRVKGAIFSSLGQRVVGAAVLDLFAGTGGLGIEALSRGAESALFVDESRQASDTIERNLTKTKLDGRVRQQDVFDFLRHVDCAMRFDIVFADPPYQKMDSGEHYTDKLLANESLPRLVADEGIFVLEKRPDESRPASAFWAMQRAKKYGATEVLFLSPVRKSP